MKITLRFILCFLGLWALVNLSVPISHAAGCGAFHCDDCELSGSCVWYVSGGYCVNGTTSGYTDLNCSLNGSNQCVTGYIAGVEGNCNAKYGNDLDACQGGDPDGGQRSCEINPPTSTPGLPGPTPTTDPGCLGDSSCPGNTCLGSTCIDCSGTIRGGTKDCSTTPPPPPPGNTIGGRVTNPSGAGVSGAIIDVYDDAKRLDATGGHVFMSTDVNGYYSTGYVDVGNVYAVRLNSLPAGYVPPLRANGVGGNMGWTFDSCLGRDTSFNSSSYECQAANTSDCGGNYPTGNDRCNFIADPLDPIPVGFQDPPSNALCTLYGWTCDPSRYSAALSVHIYLNATTFVGAAVANEDNSDPGIASACGGTTAHRWHLTLPALYRDATNHSFNSYAIGINGAGIPNGFNPQLGTSPRIINCPAPVCTPPSAPALTAVSQSFLCTPGTRLTWTAPTTGVATGYRIYKNGVFLKAVAALPTNTTDDTAACGTNPTYTVSAVVACGSEGPQSNSRTSPLLNCTPAAPASISATDGNVDLTTITWPTVANITKYVVNRNNAYFPPDVLPAPNPQTTDNTCLGPVVPYSYKVQAVQGSCPSAFSPPDTGYCIPNPNWYQTNGDVTVNGTVRNEVPDTFTTIGLITATNASRINWGGLIGIKFALTTIHPSVVTNPGYTGFYNTAVAKAGANLITVAAANPDLNAIVASNPGRSVDGVYYIEDTAANISLGTTGVMTTVTSNVVLIASGAGPVTLKPYRIGAPANVFVLLAKNDIYVDRDTGTLGDPTVSADGIQGIYIAGGTFYDTNDATTPYTLRVNGTVIGLGGVRLNRVSSTPAYPKDYFVFNPGYVMNLPPGLRSSTRFFNELAP